MDIPDLKKKAAEMRIDTLNAIHKAGSGFMGSSMSIIEILVTLYYGDFNGLPIMKVDSQKPGWDGQDYLVLSKGHAAASLYAVLADLGFFDKSELDFLRQVNSLLQARPRMKIPGVCASTITYSQGLSTAMGLAASIQMERNHNRVFAILGDAELQSGQVWEAAMAAAHYKLRNLIVFVDNNKFQEGGPIRGVMEVNPIQAKFEAFGWQVLQVRDGHDFDQLLDAIYRAFRTVATPVCIWCHTVKGKGVEFAEGKPGYHRTSISDEEIKDIIPKIKKKWNLSQ